MFVSWKTVFEGIERGFSIKLGLIISLNSNVNSCRVKYPSIAPIKSLNCQLFLTLSNSCILDFAVWNKATLLSYQSYSQSDVIVSNDLLKLRTKRYRESAMMFDKTIFSAHSWKLRF